MPISRERIEQIRIETALAMADEEAKLELLAALDEREELLAKAHRALGRYGCFSFGEEVRREQAPIADLLRGGKYEVQ